MKKYLLAALVVLSASTFAANVTVFGGVNMNGEVKYTDDSKIDTKQGYTVGLEVNKSVAKFDNSNVELGFGTKYDSTIIAKEKGTIFDENEDFKYASALPIYGSAKYTYKINHNIGLYIQGKVGYTFALDGKFIKDMNNALSDSNIDAKFKIEGGAYTGLALGADINNYTLGISYDISKVTEKITGSDADLVSNAFSINTASKAEYKTVALTVGYKFGK